MKYFSSAMIYPILPYDVWEIFARFYDSPDFTILPLLPYAILEITLWFFLFYRFYDFLSIHLNERSMWFCVLDSPIFPILPILRFNHNHTLLWITYWL